MEDSDCKYRLYDYVDKNGVNQIEKWSLDLQKTQRAKLNSKLDQLKLNGYSLYPEPLAGSNTPSILKLKIKGNIQLRPMLCKGTVNLEKEFTLLLGAVEKDFKLIPAKADESAAVIRASIFKDTTLRKCHVRVS